jgi:hypothetical protein
MNDITIPDDGSVPPELVKGDAYFLVLHSGEVYQARYRGFHPETRCFWFAPMEYRVASEGPQWVYYRQIRVLRSLSASLTVLEFEAAISALLQ